MSPWDDENRGQDPTKFNDKRQYKQNSWIVVDICFYMYIYIYIIVYLHVHVQKVYIYIYYILINIFMAECNAYVRTSQDFRVLSYVNPVARKTVMPQKMGTPGMNWFTTPEAWIWSESVWCLVAKLCLATIRNTTFEDPISGNPHWSSMVVGWWYPQKSWLIIQSHYWPLICSHKLL